MDIKRPRNNNVLLILAMLLGGMAVFSMISSKDVGVGQPLTYSQVETLVKEGQVDQVILQGQKLRGTKKDGTEVYTTIPFDQSLLLERLSESDVNVKIEEPKRPNFLLSAFLTGILPVLLLVGLFWFMMRQMQGGGRGGAMGFGKSRAKLLTENSKKVTFGDVAGIDEAKAELSEVVDFLKTPEKFRRLGGKIPHGLLLVGPPGTGKTLLARAVAGEADVPFFTISGSDFVEMFVGVGASRVRDMFTQGKKHAPAILFIDEIDAVGRHRGAGLGGGNDEREQTLNQLLVEMDGFEGNESLIIIAATNRPDVLDPALLRPGRFDREVTVPNPDVKGREEILKIHSTGKPLAPDVKLGIIARGTPGFSGADLENLVNEAALWAGRNNKRVITNDDFEYARDKVMMGPERRSMLMSDEEKKLTAYHEAGHAIVSLFVEGNDPLHKVTIVPRGRALGVTWSLPEKDQLSVSYKQLCAKLAMMFGGRAAEEKIFGLENVTTGASGDIMQATDLSRRMVTEWGMSEKLGRIRYTSNQEEVFLGHSVAQSKNLSDETAGLIDAEVRRFIEEAEKKAEQVLQEHSAELEYLAQGLLEYETLDADEVRKVIKGEKLNREEKEVADNNREASSVLPTSAPPVPEEPVLQQRELTSEENSEDKV